MRVFEQRRDFPMSLTEVQLLVEMTSQFVLDFSDAEDAEAIMTRLLDFEKEFDRG